LEGTVAKQIERAKVSYEYESKDYSIPYLVPASNHVYLPDFVLNTSSGKVIYLEAKGIWDYNDRYKHLLIRKQHPDLDIRFVFLRAGNRIRKGSRTTYRDICEGRGRGNFKGCEWKYGDGGKIPQGWLTE
jgi:hypothetical protein